MFSLYDMRKIRIIRAAAAAHAAQPTPETKEALTAAEKLCYDRAGVCPDGTIAYAVMEEYQTNVDAPNSPTWGAKPTGEWRKFAEYGDPASPSEPSGPRTVERPPMPHGPDALQWGPDSPCGYCAYAPERTSSPCGYRSPTDTEERVAKRPRAAGTGWD
jgi:hypothetical protein